MVATEKEIAALVQLAKSKKASAPETLAWVIRVGRALTRGDPVTEKLREEIIAMLDFLALDLFDLIKAPRMTKTRTAAKAVRYLVEVHQVKVAACVSAVIDDRVGTAESRRLLTQCVEREYRNLKRSGRSSFWDQFNFHLPAALAKLKLDKRKNE